MEKQQLKIIIFILLLICSIWIWKDSEKIEDLMMKSSNLKNQLDDYSNALDEANSNIEQANSNIEDAQWYAWSSYDDMGYALDNLETVETISDP